MKGADQQAACLVDERPPQWGGPHCATVPHAGSRSHSAQKVLRSALGCDGGSPASGLSLSTEASTVGTSQGMRVCRSMSSSGHPKLRKGEGRKGEGTGHTCLQDTPNCA